MRDFIDRYSDTQLMWHVLKMEFTYLSKKLNHRPFKDYESLNALIYITEALTQNK